MPPKSLKKYHKPIKQTDRKKHWPNRQTLTILKPDLSGIQIPTVENHLLNLIHEWMDAPICSHND